MKDVSSHRMSAPITLGGLVALAVVFLAGCAATDGEITNPTCNDPLQTLVDAAARGTAVEAPGGCVYRETVTIDKPLTLKAAPVGTEIRGSDVWGDAVWSRHGFGWISSKDVPRLSTESDWKCEPGKDRCRWPEQVFVNGRQLLQVAAGTVPGAGQFALDADRRVILGDNPSGKTVEVTVRDHWIVGQSGGVGVTIDGFTMKHAASEGVNNNWNNDWTVKNGDYSYAHTSNLMLKQATGLLALDNKIHHSGQKGVAGNNADLTLKDNEIYDNNTEGFDSSWNAGGVKVSSPHTVTFDGNTVYGNSGNGLWLDVPADDQILVIKDNRVHHNDANGIRSEVTDNDVQIHGNVVWENGWGRGGGNDAGISVNASHDNRVHNNVVAWNENGILVTNPLRTDVHPEETEYDLVHNVEVDHNDILMDNRSGFWSDGTYALGWVQTNPDGNLYEPAANNRGHDNRFWYPAPEGPEGRYAWEVGLASIDAFDHTRGGERSGYLSESEKDSVAKASGVPSSPP